jgi:pimeloyl-ACP methyl ester carboxylesterase
MGKVVLVHGAWHGPWCWEGVVAALEARGIEADAVELPLAGYAADCDAARAAIEAAGDGAVVCGHSYGGAVISRAASGLPNVSRLVYLTAFQTEPGEDPNASWPPTRRRSCRLLCSATARSPSTLTASQEPLSVP